MTERGPVALQRSGRERDVADLPAAARAIGSRSNKWLCIGLAVAAAISTLATFRTLVATYPLGVDLAIPLRATERWMAGGSPYLASSFLVTSGAGQPFLYPPFVLPLLAPLTVLPGAVVTIGWGLACLAAAAWTCRRLGIPWWAVPITMAWPPFAEALLGLNVQVLLIAAFVALFFDPATAAGAPRERDLGRSTRPPFVDGVLATAIAVLKASQVHTWLYLVRRHRRAAVLGLALPFALVVATLPFTGVGLWLDWLAQVRLAAQPSFAVGGISLIHELPSPLGYVIAVGSVLLIFVVPRREAAAWVGLLTIVGAPDLHVFGLLFLLPALVGIRREIGLLAACSIGLFTVAGSWVGVGLAAGALILSLRWPSFLEAATPDLGPDARASDIRLTTARSDVR